MYGPSRANFHGVPRILENTLPSYLEQSNNNDPDWNIYAEYMSTSPIVISIVFLRNPFVFYRPHCAGDFGMPALNATLDTLGQLESGKSDSSSYSTTDSLNFTNVAN
ncbi:1620_t:CDS:2 [Entrophospora sp. SA101]|nr:1620_t:CDS:2 [Entrophospora sp. SA101]